MRRLTTKAKALATLERRKTERVRLRARVAWRVLGDREPFSPAELKDIGAGGLVLLVDRPCKRGMVIVTQLENAAEAEPMLLRAEWAKEEPDNTWLVGCSFTCPITKDELQAFLAAARKAAERPLPAERPKPSADPFLMGSASERRAAPRRGGQTVPVSIWRTEGGTQLEALVEDRSLTGLGILIRWPLTRGTQLTVRLRNAPDTTPALKVQVRTCRQKGNQWLLGCRFVNSPPANVLVLFG